MQLHYQTLGQGQPLILLHGLFGSSNNWGAVAKHFSQYFQVICVDLRNHGSSPYSESQTYDDMSQDIAELCDALNLNTIHLLGHSLGGKVAMQFATQYPQRVDELVIVDMAMRAYADAHTHLINAMLAVELSTISSRSEVDLALRQSIDLAMVRHFLLMNLVKVGDQLTWRINLAALKANYSAMQQAVCAPTLYDKPCLIIRGEHSDYVSDDDIKHIKAHFTQAQFASLPTGHWVHAEQPQAFIALVEKFLRS
jgi:pimeloyl-ACP methyl ester carboxylesterase